MPAIKFDWTINLGHIITFGSLVGALLIFMGATDQRLKALENGQTSMTTAITTIASQSVAIEALDRRVTRIENRQDQARSADAEQ